jgi:hypothetical protein
MKTNQPFSLAQVQHAARSMRKAYVAMSTANGAKDTSPLLKKGAESEAHGLGKDAASLLVELAMKNAGHPAITGSNKTGLMH